MCLILFAINPDAETRLVVAANRDEFYGRPAKDADFWADEPGILAGRDEEMGGTWLGVTRTGRFAAVTNFREDPPSPLPPRSRGELPTDFLRGDMNPDTYTSGIAAQRDEYRGFNLLMFDGENFGYYCNRTNDARQLPDGSYGLSNQVLDCDWPKVVDGREKIARLVQNQDDALVNSLFAMLADDGDGREFSNSFIKSEQYGTRAATVVIIRSNGDIYFEERLFETGGKPTTSRHYSINENVSCNACS